MSHLCAAQSSGLLSSSKALSTINGRLQGLIVLTDGTNAATVIIYDNPSAGSGTVLAKLIVPGASSSASLYIPEGGIQANAGLYCSISGTGAAAVVHYSLG